MCQPAPRRQVRICFSLSSLLGGGAERVATALMASLRDRGHAVSLVTLSAADEDVYPVPDGVERVALGEMRPSSSFAQALLGNIRRIRRLRSALLARQPDVVISFQSTVNILTLLALTKTPVPILASERVDPRHQRLSAPWAILRSAVYPHAAALVMQTESVHPWARAHTRGGRVEVIPNPLGLEPVPRRIDAERTRRLLVAVGRLEPQKGYDVLLDAFAEVAAVRPDWDLAIYGEGSQREALLTRAARLGVDRRVALLGFLADVTSAFSTADAYVLSSRYEGFPNSLLEAMAHGLPVVATDCPSGPSDLIDHGVNGLLARPGSASSLRDALLRMTGDPAERERMGAEALTVRKAFALPTVTDAWERLIFEIARQPATR